MCPSVMLRVTTSASLKNYILNLRPPPIGAELYSGSINFTDQGTTLLLSDNNSLMCECESQELYSELETRT